MKFFNLDLHISVIEDISQTFRDLGHEVVSWNLSNHNWVFNRQPVRIDVINQDNWANIDDAMCDRFYDKYKDTLNEYDAFLTTHPPVFSRLFKRWNKPIICVASIRYEVPYSTRPDEWNKFTKYLVDGYDSGQIKLVANSKFDAAYGEYFTERPWEHIPNLCEYTRCYYRPNNDKFLYYSRLNQYAHYLGGSHIPNLIEKHAALGSKYTWDSLTRYRGIVGVPYNISTMSIFEFYNQNIPMFFPSVDLMVQMKKDYPDYVLAETSWNQTWNLPSGSSVKPGPNDPNDFKDLNKQRAWYPLADFYDTDWMPHIQYFNTWSELADRLASIKDHELLEISKNMYSFNSVRKQRVREKWTKILNSIKVG